MPAGSLARTCSREEGSPGFKLTLETPGDASVDAVCGTAAAGSAVSSEAALQVSCSSDGEARSEAAELKAPDWSDSGSAGCSPLLSALVELVELLGAVSWASPEPLCSCFAGFCSELLPALNASASSEEVKEAGSCWAAGCLRLKMPAGGPSWSEEAIGLQ